MTMRTSRIKGREGEENSWEQKKEMEVNAWVVFCLLGGKIIFFFGGGVGSHSDEIERSSFIKSYLQFAGKKKKKKMVHFGLNPFWVNS